MPKIRWEPLPREKWAHLRYRAKERRISEEDLHELARWKAEDPDVPDGDWYKRAQQQRLEPERDAHYPVHSGLALHLITGLTNREFDICALRDIAPQQYEGHAYSYIHRTYLTGRSLPVR